MLKFTDAFKLIFLLSHQFYRFYIQFISYHFPCYGHLWCRCSTIFQKMPPSFVSAASIYFSEAFDPCEHETLKARKKSQHGKLEDAHHRWKPFRGQKSMSISPGFLAMRPYKAAPRWDVQKIPGICSYLSYLHDMHPNIAPKKTVAQSLKPLNPSNLWSHSFCLKFQLPCRLA